MRQIFAETKDKQASGQFSEKKFVSLNTTQIGTCQPFVKLLIFSILINLSIYSLFYINPLYNPQTQEHIHIRKHDEMIQKLNLRKCLKCITSLCKIFLFLLRQGFSNVVLAVLELVMQTRPDQTVLKLRETHLPLPLAGAKDMHPAKVLFL